jgi:hypothetical protein
MLLDRLILPSPLLKIISVATAMQRIFQERREQKRQVKKHVLFNSRPLRPEMAPLVAPLKGTCLRARRSARS